MIHRIFVEKRRELATEAAALTSDLRSFLGIDGIEYSRIINRYDVENISKEVFDEAVKTVFSEPQCDVSSETVDLDNSKYFAVEYLPGQFDARADSAEQCVQIMSMGERPVIRSAKIYAFYGDISDEQMAAIKKYLINPVESREASMELPDTLIVDYSYPEDVKVLEGFRKLEGEGISSFIKQYGLAMDEADLKFCVEYFKSEHRDPTMTEIRMIDTYWSDHCRHTTFGTIIDDVTFEDEKVKKAYERYLGIRKELNRTKPICLMDMGTIGAKYLKKQGKLNKLDESEEINACTVKTEVEIDGKKEPWLLLFKNETHNHPTEIEPFGGAATCIGGAIRDPLSGRAYVYGAMRLTGAADPLKPISETIKGKLPQKKIVTTASAGYSSYGNQIGLATGIVDEIYDPGYVAKHMEVGAVIAAAPEKNVKRERPENGDIVILIGGRTGRDGCGGATGSSKSHNLSSLSTCGAEVQKGNAPEERKLQRFFRNPDASVLIKRCNDFGAGGVSVAVGELADGLDIELDKVPKKYAGLDGTELAISESQERMAVVVEEKSVDKFLKLASEENIEATVIARVTDTNRLVMNWRGKTIVDISRDFLNSNGAEKHICIKTQKSEKAANTATGDFAKDIKSLATDINICSKRGLAERFDSTIGAGTVVMPFGGKYQLTPSQTMVQKLPVMHGETNDCSLMSWGFDVKLSEKDPFSGAYIAVVESLSKLVASGAEYKDIYLSFQEYFKKPGNEGERWGQPLEAVLGALMAQVDFEVAAIGGKDSMSGSFEDINVPPTLISFAVTQSKTDNVITNEFKNSGNYLYLFKPEVTEIGLPKSDSLISIYGEVNKLFKNKKAVSGYAVTRGGIAEAVMKMSFGNGIGFAFEKGLKEEELFESGCGAILVETTCEIEGATLVGRTTDDGTIKYDESSVSLKELCGKWEDKLEPVYACNLKNDLGKPETVTSYNKSVSAPMVKKSVPKVAIPAFPGTNCEYDTARAFERAGAEPVIYVVKNLTADNIKKSAEEFSNIVRDSQMIFIPGGFSGGDEPDGSGKFICSFFRAPEVKEVTMKLLDEGGLMAGICNGFQALVKLGLVPYGKIIDADENCPTLTYNIIGRHQSRIVRTRVASSMSPWLSMTKPGEVYSVPISHGEGRFVCSEKVYNELKENGQIATQYVDFNDEATYDIHFNPNGSFMAIEGITSKDGRILGKMGHSERIGQGLYKNVYGNYDIKMFESAVKYFK